MHLNDDTLRTLLDGEMPPARADQAQEHLRDCPECRSRMEGLRSRSETVWSIINALAPGKAEQPRPTQAAYARFQRGGRIHQTTKENPSTMSTKRPLWTALAVIMVLVMVFSLTPARAWASDLLGLFRVQRVTVIQFNPEAARNAHESLDANRDAIEQVFNENLQITEGGDAYKVAGAEEAAAGTGFTPRVPAAFGDPQFAIQPGMHGELTIDQPTFQALIDAVGVETELPASVDGEVVTVDVQNAVMVADGCSPVDPDEPYGQECAALVQMPSPTVNAPDGLNVQAMGEAMLLFMGVPAEEAAELSQRIDWTSTLILPVPQGEGVQVAETQVDGVPATFIKESESDSYLLIWVKDEIMYGLSGSGTVEDAMSIAGTLQ